MSYVANVLRSSNLHCISCTLHSFFQKYSVNITIVCYEGGPPDKLAPRAAMTEPSAASLEVLRPFLPAIMGRQVVLMHV